jgi:hypothetical protein
MKFRLVFLNQYRVVFQQENKRKCFTENLITVNLNWVIPTSNREDIMTHSKRKALVNLRKSEKI